MKVNPIGIQSYQQLTRQDAQRPSAQQQEEAAAQAQNGIFREPSLTIEPKAGRESSSLAIQGPKSSYAQFLSNEEKQALDLLFNRFRDTERFGPGYRDEAVPSTDGDRLGQIVDLKV